MTVTHQTQAILLLTAYLGKPAKGDPKPLTATEWGRFAQWLRNRAIQPEALLLEDPLSILTEWRDRMITVERIQFLLNRAGALGLAMEKWERVGLWVLPRSDENYPQRLKKLLRNESPAILFGCGKKGLLNQGGVAVVGSRDASTEDLAFTAQLGGEAARQGVSVILGGARGVDEAAMLGALEHDGTVIGVLADSLLRATTSAKYRKALTTGNLVLVSPFNPEAGFDIGNAMSRNKYIYCLADTALVIATSKGKGGTWNGALENLKAGWVPVWVKRHQDENSGNFALVQQGARRLPEGNMHFSALFQESPEQQPSTTIMELIDVQLPVTVAPLAEPGNYTARTDMFVEQQLETTNVEMQQQELQAVNSPSFYDLFLRRLEQFTTNAPATPDELSELMELHKLQVNVWLKRAIFDGYANKMSKPTRYQWLPLEARQSSLFHNTNDTND